MGNKKSEFYNRIRLGLEDKLLKNHDVTIEYPMDEEDEIVFGVIGNYERDYMVRDELEDNIQFTKGDSIELLKIVDELILTNSKLDENDFPTKTMSYNGKPLFEKEVSWHIKNVLIKSLKIKEKLKL